MSYEIIAAEYFKRRYTKLRKTYRRIEEDYASLLELLENNPSEGDAVSQDLVLKFTNSE
jgi:hypothetical protein